MENTFKTDSKQTTNLQQHTGMGVYVWPWVLHLAGLQQNVRHNLVDLRDQLEHREVRQML